MSLAEALAQRAAEQVTVGDAHLPAHFGDAAAEYAAARDGAGLAHRALRALVRFSGEDRVKFLQGLLTNDVANLAPGRGCRSLFLDNKGHVRGVLDLWAGDEAIVAGCEQAFVNDVLPDLTRYILGADVQAADLRADKAVLSVLGPGADEVLQRAGAQPPADHPWAHCAARIADTDLWLARTPDLATAGVELHVPVDAQETVWEALQAAMGEAPATIGWQAAEALRVEAGGVRMGREISGEEFPQELLLDDAVNYEKG
jgi:glycine cleavage system aminomethyltransferase T